MNIFVRVDLSTTQYLAVRKLNTTLQQWLYSIIKTGSVHRWIQPPFKRRIEVYWQVLTMYQRRRTPVGCINQSQIYLIRTLIIVIMSNSCVSAAVRSVALGIFRVISAFCGTPVPQNAELTRKIQSFGSSAIVGADPMWQCRLTSRRHGLFCVHSRFHAAKRARNLKWTQRIQSSFLSHVAALSVTSFE